MNTLTQNLVDQRVRDAAIEQYRSLLHQAHAASLTIEPDTIRPNTWIIRCPCHTLVNHLTVSYGLERAA